MLISQIVELKPTKDQESLFFTHAQAARIARNDLIELWRQEGLKPKEERVGYLKLRPVFNKVKFEAHPWFKDVSSLATKGGAMDAEDAIRRFYRHQGRKPRFKGRGKGLAFKIDNGVGTVCINGLHLTLPKIGQVKMKESLRWPGKAIRGCRIKEKAGRWYASLPVEISEQEYAHSCGEGTLGIDLGLKTFATIAYPDGAVEKVEAPEPFKRSRRVLRRANRKLARRKIGGRNRAKARKDVARRHGRMASIRKDFLHKLSHKLTAQAETIQVESLSIKGWQKQWGRKTSDLAPSEFLRHLEYKSAWRGGQFVKADRNFPSTQLCHVCGYRSGKLDLSVRVWQCPSCGKFNDRDANAALNIRDYKPGVTRCLPLEAV